MDFYSFPKKISCCCSTVLVGVLSNLSTKSGTVFCVRTIVVQSLGLLPFQICLSTSLGEGQSWRAIHKSLEDHERVSYTAAEPSSVRKHK